MSISKGLRWLTRFSPAGWLAGPAVVVTLGAGCGIALPGALNCDTGIAAKADALQGAVNDLVKVSGQMRASLAVACAAIATDLGQTPPTVGDGTGVSDAVMQQVCTMATTAIKAKAGGPLAIAVEGGHCQVAAQAQFDCEAKCDVSGMCTPGSIEVRCAPGDISGECDATCKASAICEGSASVAAQCQGSCEASCTGTCSGMCVGTCDGATSTGTCSGMCVGKCGGSCKGTCNGDCTLDATANVMCGANVSCRGGCSVAYKAPTCEGTLTPPMCNLDADCEAGCKGQGSLEATCTPPKVELLASGDATLTKTLQANLPAILNVLVQGKLVAQAATDVSGAATNVGTAVVDSAGCALKYGASFATQLEAAVAASATVSVSVQVSVSVNAATVGG